MKNYTRRSFLQCAGLACAALALTACGSNAHADIVYSPSSMDLPASARASSASGASSAAATASPAASAAWDETGFTAALNGCIGWGGDAGSSLKSVIAACGLLDWGEDNSAASVGSDALSAAAGTWLAGLSGDDRSTFADNWSSISDNAQNMLLDPDGMAGLLSDAGNPNKHSHYTSGNWTALQTALNDALTAAGLPSASSAA